ncbi:putative polysaccharide biosynthesis protein [Paenibacillus sp. 1001270B_150601_E10]|uniref:putative polysaccharide biosynthesis protein n=1 Tax=Paenibacillus sp. 1001270B_150601_E10 TaxID=2787079 RepID=UPI00189F654C|nr:polysaccharide biosynthesis protein [Paenibacillus sp. 1001270B_150601_E10]
MQTELKPERGHSSHILHGAMLLGLASVLSKIIGTFQKIPLQNIGGDGVFGIYNAVYPFYVLLSTAAAAGIPIAISRLVAEQELYGDKEEQRSLLIAALLLVEIIGAIGFMLMYTEAERIAGWIGNSHTIAAIRASSFAMLVIPLAAVLRGYEQGKGRMTSTAVSQVIEQLARVTVMIVLLLVMTRAHAQEDSIAAGAVFGSFAGGIFGIIVLTLMMRRERGTTEQAWTGVSLSKVARWTKRIAWTAVPICLGALVTPIVNVVDVFTVPRMLLHDGWTETEAIMEYGLYSRALPLTQLITLTAGSLVVGLVPTIASSWQRASYHEARTLIKGAMHTAWIIGSAATVGLVVLSRPINISLYTNDAGMTAFILLSCTVLMGTLQVVSAGLLQGIGALRAPVIHLLIASVVKVVLNLLLVPMLGIAGAGWSAIAALSVAAVLNIRVLGTQTELNKAEWMGHSFKLFGSLLGMGMAAWVSAQLVMGFAGGRLSAVIATTIGVLIGVAVFAVLSMRLRVLEPEEWLIVPRVGHRLEAMARRMLR